jgi:hypothetical protein
MDELNNQMDIIMNQIMTTEEASELWGLSQDYIKHLCSANKVIARKRGKTWILLRNQPSPAQKP